MRKPLTSHRCATSAKTGRIGLYEVMLMTPAIRKLVTAAADDIKAIPSARRNRGALLHDATEAYLGDMVSGLKRLNPDYRVLEHLWATVIETRFDVSFARCPIIKDADLRARLSECRDLFSGEYPRELLLGGEGDRQPWGEACRPLDPDASEWEFLALANRLGIVS